MKLMASKLTAMRAFTASDWRTLLGRAGLRPTDADVRGFVPFRLCVARLKAR